MKNLFRGLLYLAQMALGLYLLYWILTLLGFSL